MHIRRAQRRAAVIVNEHVLPPCSAWVQHRGVWLALDVLRA
jgi:hypothetical protein